MGLGGRKVGRAEDEMGGEGRGGGGTRKGRCEVYIRCTASRYITVPRIERKKGGELTLAEILGVFTIEYES